MAFDHDGRLRLRRYLRDCGLDPHLADAIEEAWCVERGDDADACIREMEEGRRRYGASEECAQLRRERWAQLDALRVQYGSFDAIPEHELRRVEFETGLLRSGVSVH